MPKNDPAVRLRPHIYQAWIDENPKPIDGGPIILEEDPDIDDENAVVLPSRHVDSQILPQNYAEITMIFSQYSEYNGIQFYVVPDGYDYLIRADQTHPDGNFKTVEGDTYGNYPHFHELDYYSTSDNDRKPGTLRRVTEQLFEGIPPEQLLDAFMSKYYLDDGRIGSIQPPTKHVRQKEISEY
jgi:hypothetical protein